ncbi:MAG: 4a-hydroxytetrahydrobiopterin dehydratase [Chloroflexia bacterium]
MQGFTEAEMAEALKDLPAWTLQSSTIPGKEPNERTELTRTYRFASFEQAIDFMYEAAKYIARVDHHPRWENSWRSVTVSLTTWDAGNVPTRLDVELARYLDSLYESYAPKPKPR